MASDTTASGSGLSGTAARTLSDRRIEEIESSYAGVVRRRNLYTVLMIVVCTVVIAGGFRTAEEANSGTFWGGITAFFDYPSDIIREAVERGWGWFAVVWKYVPALIETINIAILSTLIGFLGGGLLSFVASRNLVGSKPVVWSMRRVMDITRALPELVLALFAVLVIGPEALAAVFAAAALLQEMDGPVADRAAAAGWEDGGDGNAVSATRQHRHRRPHLARDRPPRGL